jgi:hypothetical protein
VVQSHIVDMMGRSATNSARKTHSAALNSTEDEGMEADNEIDDEDGVESSCNPEHLLTAKLSNAHHVCSCNYQFLIGSDCSICRKSLGMFAKRLAFILSIANCCHQVLQRIK